MCRLYDGTRDKLGVFLTFGGAGGLGGAKAKRGVLAGAGSGGGAHAADADASCGAPKDKIRRGGSKFAS